MRFDDDEVYARSKWKTNIICVFSLPSGNGQTQSKLCRGKIQKHSRMLKVRNFECPEGIKYEICTELNCPCCIEQATVNLVHIHCLQLAKRRWNDLSTPFLVRIARSLRPITPSNVATEVLGIKPGLTKLPDSEIAPEDSSLGLVLANIHRRLPGELQRMVCEHLRGEFFFWVARCLETLDWIDDHQLAIATLPNTSPKYHHPLRPFSSFKRLVANTVNILGETCLSRIGGDSPTSYDMEIEIRQSPISGIKYALGIYGVVGLRVLYEDGSSSAWLGRSPGKLFRIFNIRLLRDLRILTDGLKYLSLDSDITSDSQTPETFTISRKHKIYWYQNVDFTPHDKYKLYSLHPIPTTIRVDIEGCIAQYLPFQPASQQQRSLTIFFSLNGTSCIQIGSDPGQRLGAPDTRFDRPLTFYLRPGETVKSLRLLAREKLYRPRELEGLMHNLTRGFYILVRTSEDRMFYAAPNRLRTDPLCRFVDLSGEDSHTIHGIFIVQDEFARESLTNIGVKSGANREDQPDLQNPPAPLSHLSIKVRRPQNRLALELERGGAILTKANLNNVKELRVQKNRNFYYGLLIHRHDDSIDTLGVWNASRPESISTIYVYGDRPLTGLTFVLSEDYRKYPQIRDVVDITLDQVDSSVEKFVWDMPHKEVAWWYTLSSSENYVDYWDGEEQEVSLPKGTHPCEQQVD
ncbi:unnamed protein product [Clonostachys rosea]|uniref:Uncharacterized protein n=1 Tax=Bionectria ochroleuca TaxID=29856 RepID=A0ABY6U521_BIOOC|nr:unnamed protein product [Clonostachys rosea]